MKLSYADFLQKTNLTQQELLALAWNNLIMDSPAEGMPSLPAPPLLMFNRVTEMTRLGNKGRIVAEQDIGIDDWFFQCHFRSDPVQPGCLGVDAIWQLLGLFLALSGAKGTGRALGVKEIEFFGQVRPHNKLVRYEVNIRRMQILSESSFIIGSGLVYVDSDLIYQITDAKVGTFIGIAYEDYPHQTTNAIGGAMTKTNQKENIKC